MLPTLALGSFPERRSFALGAFCGEVRCDTLRTLLVAHDALAFFTRPLRPERRRANAVFLLTERVGALEAAFPPETSTRVASLSSYPVDGERALVWTCDGADVLFDVKHSVWRVADTERRAYAFAARDAASLVGPLVRAFRAACDATLVSAGSCRAHAAAIALDGEAIVIAGASGSGKTTTMLELLGRVDGELLAFDKTFLRAQGGIVRCLPVPASFGIERCTAVRFGVFLEHFPAEAKPRTKVRVPAQAVALRYPPAPPVSYPLRAVILPQAGSELVRLPESVGSAALARALLRGRLSPYDRDWMGLGLDPAALRRASARVLAAARRTGRVGYFAVGPDDRVGLDALADALAGTRAAATGAG